MKLLKISLVDFNHILHLCFKRK